MKKNSVKHTYNEWKESETVLSSCENGITKESEPLSLSNAENGDMEVIFTYDVIWSKSDIQWASRWDHYLKISDLAASVHWFSILNSTMIGLFLAGKFSTNFFQLTFSILTSNDAISVMMIHV